MTMMPQQHPYELYRVAHKTLMLQQEGRERRHKQLCAQIPFHEWMTENGNTEIFDLGNIPS
jgi:hypothetical protein